MVSRSAGCYHVGMQQHRVCPWWLGHLLASPLRGLFENPKEIVGRHVGEGMTVLEPGPGMGFFTLPLARLVGPTGRVVAVEVQPRMLAGLKKRLAKAGLLERVDARLVSQMSPMPANFAEQLAEPDLYHLLAYLLAQQAPPASPSASPTR